MNTRILELLFRQKLLIAALILLGAEIGILWSAHTSEDRYVSQATIWVERPADFNSFAGVEFNPYNTPAQNQAGAMRELMSIDMFVADVIARGSPGSTVTPALMQAVRRDTAVVPLGNHVLAVQYWSDDPNTSSQMVSALMDEFQLYYTNKMRDKATQVSAFYALQLEITRTNQEEASLELATYISRRPQLANVNLENPPVSVTADVEFARLLQNQSTARRNYENALAKYTDSQLALTSASGTSSALAVLDRPKVPLSPVESSKREVLFKPLIGMIAGGGLGGAIFLLTWRLDRKVRTASDLSFLGAVEVATLAPLKLPRRAHWPAGFVQLAAAARCGMRALSSQVRSQRTLRGRSS